APTHDVGEELRRVDGAAAVEERPEELARRRGRREQSGRRRVELDVTADVRRTLRRHVELARAHQLIMTTPPWRVSLPDPATVHIAPFASSLASPLRSTLIPFTLTSLPAL